MPTLYGVLGSPFVRKVMVVLTEKGIKYDHEQVFPFGPNPEYRKLHLLGRIPTYRDGDRVLPDSSVILAYLERTHPAPPLYPADPYEYARALWYEEYGDSGLAPVTGAKIFFPRVVGPRFMNRPPDESPIQKTLDEEVPPLFDYLDQEIGNKQFLVANRFTVADVGVATQFVNFKLAGCTVDANRWPELAAYVERIHNRPSFKAVIEKEFAAFKPA